MSKKTMILSLIPIAMLVFTLLVGSAQSQYTAGTGDTATMSLPIPGGTVLPTPGPQVYSTPGPQSQYTAGTGDTATMSLPIPGGTVLPTPGGAPGGAAGGTPGPSGGAAGGYCKVYVSGSSGPLWQLSSNGVDIAPGQWTGKEENQKCDFACCVAKANAAKAPYFAHTMSVYAGYCKVLAQAYFDNPDLSTNSGYGYKLWENGEHNATHGGSAGGAPANGLPGARKWGCDKNYPNATSICSLLCC